MPIPPLADLAPGSGFTYSTEGPSDWSETVEMTLPDGTVVRVPKNAQNFASTTGHVGQAPQVPDRSAEIFAKVMGSVPIRDMKTAAAAVSAAMQFQAQRGYQKDLQGGMNSVQALARWAPLLFGQGSGMSGAASMVRNLRPEPQPEFLQVPGVPGATLARVGNSMQIIRPQEPKVMSAGGRLWQVGESGAVPVTPEYETVQQETEAAPAVPAIPAQPARRTWYGRKLPAVPGEPATPAQPKETRTRRVPVLSEQAQKFEGARPLTRELAVGFLKQANGDRAKAEQLARDAGYEF